MSWAASAWAKQVRTGNVTAKAVLMALADYADENHQCFPGQVRLAWEVEVSERTVRDTLKYLEAQGLIKRDRRYVGGTRTSDLYTLAVGSEPLSEVPADSAGKADLTGKSGGGLPATGCRVTPSSRTTSSQEVPTQEKAVAEEPTYVPAAAEPEQHPSRQIRAGWYPSVAFRRNLTLLYPEVNLAESHRRFVDHHLSRQSTSRSWEAEFRKWVSSDSERILERRGGTDDMGIPRTQRKAPISDTEEMKREQQELIDLAVRSALDKKEQPDD